MSTVEQAASSFTTHQQWHLLYSEQSGNKKIICVVQYLKFEASVGNEYLDLVSVFWDVTVCSLVSRRSVLLDSAAFFFSVQCEEEI
jgi:hypothetical protein